MWIYVDDEKRVLSYNHNNMSGNTGWHETHDAQINQHSGDDFVLYDTRGIPMYRYDEDNDKLIKRTTAEMDADYTVPAHTPSIESRVETVESKQAELEESLDILLSGVTSDE